ncbi:hypothetical protein SDC9_133179 [bioreactor metagenome]|uniref:Uncharacterized protein n=1 Tax=bioreactor metagenome TaxID=1076179 RepID=A0A645D9K5_9ZZZZ
MNLAALRKGVGHPFANRLDRPEIGLYAAGDEHLFREIGEDQQPRAALRRLFHGEGVRHGITDGN